MAMATSSSSQPTSLLAQQAPLYCYQHAHPSQRPKTDFWLCSCRSCGAATRVNWKACSLCVDCAHSQFRCIICRRRLRYAADKSLAQQKPIHEWLQQFPHAQDWVHYHHIRIASNDESRRRFEDMCHDGCPFKCLGSPDDPGPKLHFDSTYAMSGIQLVMDEWTTALGNWKVCVRHCREDRSFSAWPCKYGAHCRRPFCDDAHIVDFMRDELYINPYYRDEETPDKPRKFPPGWKTYVKVDMGPGARSEHTHQHIFGKSIQEKMPTGIIAWLTFRPLHVTLADLPPLDFEDGCQLILNLSRAMAMWKSTQHDPGSRIDDDDVKREIFFQKTLSCLPRPSTLLCEDDSGFPLHLKVDELEPAEVEAFLAEYHVEHVRSGNMDLSKETLTKWVIDIQDRLAQHRARTKWMSSNTVFDRAHQLGLSPLIVHTANGDLSERSEIYDLSRWLLDVARSSFLWHDKQGVRVRFKDDIHATFNDLHNDPNVLAVPMFGLSAV